MRLSVYRRAVLQNDDDRKGAIVSLDAVARRIQSGDKGLAEHTAMLRKHLANNDKKNYKRAKETKTPAATFSGVFATRDRKVALPDKFTEHSGLLTFDIDGIEKSTGSVNGIRTVLSLHPNVLMAFVSPSDTGIKALMRIDPIPTTINDLEHKWVWKQCKAELDEILHHYGLKCDSGDDPTRLCFFAHDPRLYYDPSMPARTWDRDAYHIETQEREKAQAKRSESDRKSLENREWTNADIDPKALEHIHPDSVHYDDWFRILAACKTSGLTWQDVDAWSRQGTKHQEGDIERRWNGINTNDVSWGTVVYFAKQNGYQLPHRKRPPKLHNASSPPPRSVSESVRTQDTDDTSEKYESLDESDRRREQAADAFFTSDTNKSLHILIVKEGTGKGKTHTFLGKSKEHGKRTLMNPPHNELAAQAVETARTQGYENPYHLLGREHNWDESGIADIPPGERTADLFANNNCIMVDQIKAYTDKRLAPRTYCEHQCRFRDGCLHMAQYEGLSDRDFIASCTPGLLFDLNMRGYLESLVTTTDEITDTELAMDAVLGTESKEMPDFDFAILDDYSVSSLYTDVVFSQSEFKTLKKAWIGTPTGEFARKVLKAFDKKKPRKIVEALRKAFESTSEHHAEITKSLTQHARIGTIEYAEHSKVSAESKRLLSEKVVKYTDGGQQFIPVDFAAYKELTEKGIPCVHPKHLSTTSVGEQVTVGHSPVAAIRANVKVKDLTPVWQSTTTPITLLRIFLNSIGDERHAPIRRTFRNSDPPVAILTFSIPPQAPIGVIPQMAMLSATSQLDDTKRPFDGQPVTFSEHTSEHSQWADGVKVYQFQDARLTSGSIFEYPVDDDGKRILQSDPIGLTPTAERRICKLNDWAKERDGLTAFISYKEFTESFKTHIDNFDVVTHFDKVAGLNFDGLKYLVIFGYPKVKHDVVMEHASKQFASDHERLPKGSYDELTEIDTYTDNGITIHERRYIDPRLEKIRLQLSIEKLEQAFGRARVPRWTDTTTMLFTNAPISATSRTTLFTDTAFNIATSPSDLPAAAQRIINAEKSGDVQAVMESTGVSEWTARKRTKETRDNAKAERDSRILELHGERKSTREIESIMKADGFKVSRATISRTIKVSQNGEHLKDILIGDHRNETPPQNVDDTSVPSVLGENITNGHHPVSKTDYPNLTENEAQAELECLTEKYDYAGAAYLRQILRQKGYHT